MKKIFLSLFFLAISFFLNYHPVFAECQDLSGVSAPVCLQGEVPCNAGGWNYCCSSIQECEAKKLNPTGSVATPSLKPTTTITPCEDGAQNINTAIGPINVCDINSFTGSILKLGIGLGGGIAFLLMLVAVFMIMTSAGDPKRLQAGQELITSALMGLLLIIFSVFLLQFIGMDILKIPGFGK